MTSGEDGGRNRHSGPASTERRKKIAFFLEVSAVIGPLDKSLPRVHQMVLSQTSERIPSCFYPSSDPGSGRWADGQSFYIWAMPYPWPSSLTRFFSSP